MSAFPPESLHLGPGVIRGLLRPLWGILLALAICAQLVGTWRAYQQFYKVEAVFASLGLSASQAEDGLVEVETIIEAPQAVSFPPGSVIYTINGIAPGGTATIERYADLLAGADGGFVALEVGDREGTASRNYYLARSAEQAAKAQSFSDWLVYVVLSVVLGLLATAIGLYASTLLIRRRIDDPVAVILAIGLVGLVLTGDQPIAFYEWVISDPTLATEIYYIAYLFAFVPIAVALPAFPDSLYWPRWSGWLAIAAPVLGIASYALGFAENLHPAVSYALEGQYVLWLLVLVAIIASAIRFRHTAPGRERQQLKWAAVGFVFGLGAILVAEQLLALELGPHWVGLILRAVGSILLPLGIVMSVLGLRLNDADSAVGRSAGYAIVTLSIGAIWAGSSSWINSMVGSTVAPAVATGISTMLAAAIFVPTRDRVMKMMERKFQPALVKMRGLPAKLSPWRHDHDPADVARGALLAVVNGVNPTSAALVLAVGEQSLVLATYEVTEEEVLGALGSDPTAEEPMFPLRFELEDLLGPVGTLLLGPRNDGASYSSDERSAIALIKVPLAEALRATSRRSRRNHNLAEMMTAVDARVARLEALRGFR